MAEKFSDLISYFESLARRHVDIKHSDTEKHFFRMEVDEVLGGIDRSDAAFPMLILEGYGYNFTDNNSDNLLKNRQGGFMLIDHVADASDFDAIQEVWDHMEEIGDEILRKIKSDKRNSLTRVVRDFSFTNVEATLLATQLGNNYGIRYTYTVVSPLNTELDPTKWETDSSE